MKYMVYKKGFVSALGLIIIADILFALTLAFILYKTEIVAACVWCAMWVPLNILAFNAIRLYGSTLFFEDDVIKCAFLKRSRCIMRYSEIKEYGTVWYGRDKFICISRIELSKVQRNADAFRLYKKTKDVLILQYQKEIMSLLRIHIPNRIS